MALTGKLEYEKEIKADPKKFFHCFMDQPNHFHKAVVHEPHRATILEGDGKNIGSAIHFNYALDGKTVSSTAVKIEAVDEEKYSVTLGCYEGDVMKHYKVFKVHCQVFTGSAKCCIEYEKLNESVPEPTEYIDFARKMLEGIVALALKA